MIQKKFIRCALISTVALGLCAVIGVSCFRDSISKEESLSETGLFVMDTYCTISLEDGQASAVSQLLYELEDSLSSFDAESDVSHLNSGGTLAAGSAAGDIIGRTLKLQEQYRGHVDITSGALVQLWGITTDSPRVPEEQERKAALDTIGAAHVSISGGEISLDPGTQIDLGAVAKGYALDRAAELLREQGVSCGKISMTSSMLLYGEKPEGAPFTVAIRSPDGEGTLGTVTTDSCFLSTSGGYERFFTAEDGQTYSHILDPESGYPAETDLTTVTVFCDSGLLSDYLSTLIYMGGTASLEEHLHAETYKIVAADTAGRLYVSEGLDFVQTSEESGLEEMK
ncbi:MAG: FAD:protein FMN transferase [Ruminococcus sp.]|nr:FAD:protein FMN transferase [Ruminococcus sp.]